MFDFLAAYVLFLFSQIPPGLTVERINQEMDLRGVGGIGGSDYPYYEQTNGCGETTEGLDHLDAPESLMGINLRETCDIHDRCYMTIGVTKDECDISMKHQMEQLCEHKFSRLTQNYFLCFGASQIWYVILKNNHKSQAAYDGSQVNQQRYNTQVEKFFKEYTDGF